MQAYVWYGNMLIIKNISAQGRGSFRRLLFSLLTLNMVVCPTNVQAVLADTPEKTNASASDNSKPAAGTETAPSKEEALMVSLKRMNNLNTLIQGGKEKEALLNDITSFLDPGMQEWYTMNSIPY